MNAVSLLREQLRAAHEYLEETMADVTPEQAQWLPPGKATPIEANYIHLVQTEDMPVQSALQQKAMLAQTAWARKLGAGAPMPTPPWTEQDYFAWSRRVQIDLPLFHEYAQAVYAVSDAYMAGLAPDDLDRTTNLSSMGMSPVTLG